MASTFAGLALFNSGPHRFVIRSAGRLVRAPFQTPLELPFTINEAVRELWIVQRGRLIAPTNAELMTLMDAVQARAELGQFGTLVDHHGKQWTSMTMLSFDPDDRIDRGRVCSVRYRVEYLRFGA
ncbi:MAG: hypothetical protein SFZ24_11885 [Planctomycetota bacterium]|nr:hypothetical protein [Planctomycetota bacterium]